MDDKYITDNDYTIMLFNMIDIMNPSKSIIKPIHHSMYDMEFKYPNNIIKNLDKQIVINLSEYKTGRINGLKNIQIHGDWKYAFLTCGSLEMERIFKATNDTFTISYNYVPLPQFHAIELYIYSDTINPDINITYNSVWAKNNDAISYKYTTINLNKDTLSTNDPSPYEIPYNIPFSEINIGLPYYNRNLKVFLIIKKFNKEYNDIIPFKYNRNTGHGKLWHLPLPETFLRSICRLYILVIDKMNKNKIIDIDIYVKFHNTAMCYSGMMRSRYDI